MKLCVVFTLFLPVALLTSMVKYPEDDCIQTRIMFTQWRKQHRRNYSGSMEEKKYNTFLENLKKINQLNSIETNYPPEHQPIYGLTPFVDLSTEDFRNKYLNRQINTGSHMKKSTILKTRHKRDVFNGSIPLFFDWSSQTNVVTSVKNQGETGACWAFAGCANIEGLWAIKTGRVSPDLSPQAILDCNGIFNKKKQALACGPQGGNLQAFYEYVIVRTQ
ncbi:hypothetical protein Btru_062365 [Bulinus truncatus]|nr:hypothetical protein Btru_062365 [Bulinus truncatus]